MRGVKQDLKECKSVTAKKLNQLVKQGQVEHIIQLCAISTDTNTGEIPGEVQELVTQYKVIFQEPRGLPPVRDYDHKITLIPGVVPVNQKPYRVSPQLKDELEKQVKEMLQKGFIQPSTNPFSSPVLLVKKKEGTLHFCVDYRQLNAITMKNKYPMLVEEELLDELAGAQWFTNLDLRAGYHQIRMAASDEPKTAFKTHNGHYEFKVMPFGLSCAPGTFQGGMNITMSPVNRKCVLVFVDDILVFSHTFEEHIEHLRQVFQILQENRFFVKLSKCSFAQQQLEYLGHIISKDGVATDQSKIEAVQTWPQPTTVKKVRAFLGLAGYYRRFIQGYGVISRPLTTLLKKGQPFIWSETVNNSFLALKQALVSAPVLKLPDFSKQFTLETDACHIGIGVVLMQEGHPIAFLSKALGPRVQALSTYEKECLAIILAVDKWRAYLQHKEFIIKTDHQSLAHLTEQRLTTSIQYKAFVKLIGLQYRIQYKQGVLNKAADALSRKNEETEVNAVTTCVPTWTSNLINGYADDPVAQEMLTSLAVQPQGEGNYTLQEGVIRHKGRIYVGSNATAQQNILQALHSNGIGGHSGITATYQRVKSLFAWPQLK